MNKKTMAIISILFTALLAVAFIACQLGGAEEPAKNLTRPYISVQPESRSFFVDNYEPPELKVEIWEWDPGDGDLSYQWYRFEDIDEYCANGGTPIGGAGDTSYTPTDITPAVDKQYYFYVAVTNTKSDALDTPTMTIQSEMAVISFSASGNNPLFPIIARQPADANYSWGRSLNAMKVDARLPKVENKFGEMEAAPGALTYQWYKNSERKIAGGTPIEGADKASFMPDYDTLAMDNNYYYVKVTNTLSNRTAVSTSIPAIINMKPGEKAGAPRINQQPVDRIFLGGNGEPLTVEAESPDMGELSFQWYSNPTPAEKYDDYENWTLIPGATDSSKTGLKYKSTYSPTGSGTSYYYVKITNTNENVNPDYKTAEVISKAVKVLFTNAAGEHPFNATITIPDPNILANQRQYIRGYGGMDVAWESFPKTNPEDTELMYDPDRMGYNILRIMITPDNVDIKKTLEDLTKPGGIRPAYYENVKIVNKYGGYVAAAPWTPPKEWKSNNSKNGGGNLIPAYYRLFATYLRNFCQIMYDNGAPIYTVSISNEPNYVAGYDGCEWSPEEMKNFWMEVGHFTDGVRGYGGGREIPYVLTMNGESANTPYINRAALREPKAKAAIDLLARHIYGERKRSLWNDYPSDIQKGPETDRNKGRLEVWMTEHNINSANATGYVNDSTWNYIWRFLNDVDLVMRINNENAFVWWASKRFYSMVGDGQFGTVPGAPLPRGWALTHYARYTIDTTRLNLTSANISGTFADGTTPIGPIEDAGSKVNDTDDNLDNESVRITAYVSQDGNAISMVMWTPTKISGSGGYDMGDIKINLPDGFTINGVSAHRSTSRDDIFQPYDGIVISSDRKSAYVTLNRSQILSVKFTR